VHLAGGHAASDFCVRASGNILNYDLKRGADTRIALCDAAGRKVASIVDAYQAAGSYSFDVATSRVAKGVYVCVFESGGSKGVQRIVLK
jgi:hypothetical protein